MPHVVEVPLSEAAHRLGLTWSRAYSRLLAGELKGRKVGGRWVVEAESVAAAEQAREAGPALVGGR